MIVSYGMVLMGLVIVGIICFIIGWLYATNKAAKAMLKMMEGHTAQLEFMQRLLNDERYRNND